MTVSAKDRRRGSPSRPGATMVEASISIFVFLVFVFGMLDLGIGVMRNNMLSEAARQGVRQAIVHGKLAPGGWNGGPWGPATVTTTAAGSHPIVAAVQPILVGFDLPNTTVQAQWLDGGNNVEQRVRVTLSTNYHPMMTFIFGNPSITLSASATMPIAH